MRLLPVNGGYYLAPVTQRTPIARRVPNENATTSQGPFLARPVHAGVNNAGFVNRADYDAQSESPLFAIVGDSFIEAANVPQDRTCHGRLQETHGPRAGYSFAMSGAPLSQYLIWAEHARRTYRPDGMAFVIIFNDFDQSHDRYGLFPGYHYYEGALDAAWHLSLREFVPSAVSHLARHSRLVEYLLNNVRVQTFPAILSRMMQESREAEKRPRNGESVDPSLQADDHEAGMRQRYGARAVVTFLDTVAAKAGLPPSRIVFILDALRPALYDREALHRAQGSYFAKMRRLFRTEAESRGFQVMDLQPRFIARHRAEGTIFELPNDEHWNAAGHAVCADAVSDSKAFRSVFPDEDS